MLPVQEFSKTSFPNLYLDRNRGKSHKQKDRRAAVPPKSDQVFDHAAMSAVAPIADEGGSGRVVCFVPIADTTNGAAFYAMCVMIDLTSSTSLTRAPL